MRVTGSTARTGDSELDDIIYRISHDLRASVRAVKDLPEWLEEDLRAQGVVPSADAAETMALLTDHARKLDAMIAGLLAYSRVGRLQDRVRLLPAEVFQGVLAEVAPGPEVKFYCQFAAQPIWMGAADAAKVFQVLLSNALTHARSPDRDLEVEVVSCKSGETWELLFADNGPGIAPEAADRVFRPMVRQAPGLDAGEGGAGMGLAILRKIAAAYGGTVDLEHRRRRGGTLFRLRLPVLARRRQLSAP